MVMFVLADKWYGFAVKTFRAKSVAVGARSFVTIQT